MLLAPDFSAIAAPAPKPAGEAAQEAPAAATVPAPTAPSGSKEPLIEVSVDSLEINETNTEKIGILWNESLLFQERSIPSIFRIGTMDRMTQIQGTLDLLIKNNQARILANPTLITKSGFEANFLVGGEIPYPTVGQGGVSGVEFKKYGVSLKILPQITQRKTIDAQINVGVSNIDNANSIKLQGVTVPALSARETGTKVEVNDGETVVLSGIKQSRREKVTQRVPILGAIPLLGLLFRHKEEAIVQTSLVIFVTFRFVK
jgi:Flp pilus assembly secretin CpaC